MPSHEIPPEIQEDNAIRERLDNLRHSDESGWEPFAAQAQYTEDDPRIYLRYLTTCTLTDETDLFNAPPWDSMSQEAQDATEPLDILVATWLTKTLEEGKAHAFEFMHAQMGKMYWFSIEENPIEAINSYWGTNENGEYEDRRLTRAEIWIQDRKDNSIVYP
jgi:hypothetical protein